MPEPINNTTFEVTLTGGDKVEIGDKESADFKPHIKLNRWDGECFIAIQPAGEIEEEVEYEVEGEKIKCKYKVKQGDFEFEWETEFYPLEPLTVIDKDKDGNDVPFPQCELGGFEFEVILKKKPLTNKIVLNMEAQGLKFYYQPELTQQEIDRGAFRPNNVVGSYAVHHATRTNIHRGGATAEKYKAGIAFHIYRPKITDAEGKWVWGELHYDEQAGTLTTTIPQEFLDTAVYPVSTGTSTFGYETQGGSSQTICQEISASFLDYRVGCAFTGAAGTVTDVKATLSSDEDDTDVKAFVNEEDSGGSGNHGQIATAALANITAAKGWKTFTMSSEEIAAVDYILNVLGDADDFGWFSDNKAYIWYNSGSQNWYFQDDATYATPESPWVEAIYDTDRIFSIYCTYEEEAPPGAVPQAFMHYQRMRRQG